MIFFKNRRYFTGTFLFMAVVTVFFAACSTQPDLDTEINRVMEEYSSVGLSVAVVKDNELIFTKAYGLKDVEHDIPLATDDIFRIASISKSFTAASLMQQVELGKASLDDDVSELIGFKVRNPHFPETVITLKMLLSHTSSLNDSEGYFNLDVINPEVNDNVSASYSNTEPGTTYDYCNLNYNMAGTILERLSGVRFDKYVKEHILDPLNLYGGYFIDTLDSDKFAQIYSVDAETGEISHSPAAYSIDRAVYDNYKPGYSTPVFSPTGGMKISAPDLAKYMLMHMNKGTYGEVQIMSEESAEQMQSEIATIDALESYGLAIFTVEDLITGEKLKGHTGSAYGLYSSMFFHPEKKYGIVVITNGSKNEGTGEYNSLLKPVTNILYQHFIK